MAEETIEQLIIKQKKHSLLGTIGAAVSLVGLGMLCVGAFAQGMKPDELKDYLAVGGIAISVSGIIYGKYHYGKSDLMVKEIEDEKRRQSWQALIGYVKSED